MRPIYADHVGSDAEVIRGCWIYAESSAHALRLAGRGRRRRFQDKTVLGIMRPARQLVDSSVGSANSEIRTFFHFTNRVVGCQNMHAEKYARPKWGVTTSRMEESIWLS